MIPSQIRVVVIDPDREALGRAAHRLAHAGVHLVARPSPEEALDYIQHSRPEVVLLGVELWQQGWSRLFTLVSPETVVFPLVNVPPLAPGAGAAA